MQSVKSVVGVIGTLGAIAYCGGLLYYFLDLSGSVHEAQEIGLGPTVLGLGVVGLLFCLALIVKLVRIFAASRSPESPGRRSSDTSTDDREGDFDADAVIARHLARRSVQAPVGSPTAPPAPDGGGPARPTFGRKGT